MPTENFPEHKIASTDITVVIQGLLHRDHKEGDLAARCITSLRRHLPQAEIIISTWRHQSTDGLDSDKIIYSEEPQGLTDINGNTNNVFRQVVSTKNGIEAASRPYILKFRADHFLNNDNIAIVRDYSDTVFTKKIFKQPITFTNFFVRNPVHLPMLFHISDLVQFGRREDMLDLWSTPFPDIKEMTLKKLPRFRVFGRFAGFTSFAQVPEQTLTLSWLKKHGWDIKLPHISYTSYPLLKLWEELLTDHFHVLNWQRSGVEYPKRFHYSFYTKHANYTEDNLTDVRVNLKGKFYRLRYAQLLLNKYISCWLDKGFLRSAASILLFSMSPSLAKKMREHYRAKRIPTKK